MGFAEGEGVSVGVELVVSLMRCHDTYEVGFSRCSLVSAIASALLVARTQATVKKLTRIFVDVVEE